MNRILILCILALFAVAGCKSSKQAKKSETAAQTTQPKVFSVPTSTPAKEPTSTKQPTTMKDEKPIAVRKEQISFTQPTDKSKNELNTYFVILGSFSQLENAKSYRETLVSEGFTPIILHSETGYYRICVDSYKGENEARNRISQVRTNFPKYSDVWLLVKE